MYPFLFHRCGFLSVCENCGHFPHGYHQSCAQVWLLDCDRFSDILLMFVCNCNQVQYNTTLLCRQSDFVLLRLVLF